MKKDDKITRRTFLKKTGKLVYLTPVIYTFFTEAKHPLAEAAQGLQVAAENLQAGAERGNQAAAQALQRMRERLVSPPWEQ